MLLISPNPALQILGFRKETPVYHPSSGKVIDTIPALGAEFFHGGAPSWAVEQAVENPSFQARWSGLPDGQERRAMVASFDTDEYAKTMRLDAETKDEFEQWLLDHPHYGTYFIRAIPPEEIMALPWPSYDQTHHMQVAKIAVEIGVDLDYVIRWEASHKNRDYVLRSLQEELDKQPESEPLVAA